MALCITKNPSVWRAVSSPGGLGKYRMGASPVRHCLAALPPGWPLSFLFGGDTSFAPNRYREGVLFMVTWEGLFAFCMVIIAVISLARQNRD